MPDELQHQPEEPVLPWDGADPIVKKLLPLYHECCEDRPGGLLAHYPNPVRIVKGLKYLLDLMFPGKMTSTTINLEEIPDFLTQRILQARTFLLPELELALPFRWKGRAALTENAQPLDDVSGEAASLMEQFLSRLPDIRNALIKDVQAGYEGDPAALSYAEVKLAYPGLQAIATHRIAHELYRLNVPIIPRVMSEWTHSKTGVDIHPGATIGASFFIDHATGVVIGETAEIGDHCKFYQGVTIGARSFALNEDGQPVKHIKRHPTVEDNVIVYAHATVLGGKTVIGKGSTIGGNVFLMESVPPNSFVASNHPELRIKTSDS